MTAGQLAQATGLTTASITGVIDRLEQAGYARRERDAHDRRRVVVRLIADAVHRDVAPVFAPMLAAWHDIARSYTDDELALIAGFQRRAEAAIRDQLTARTPRQGPADQRRAHQGPARGRPAPP